MAPLSHEAWYTALDWAPGQVAVNIEHRQRERQTGDLCAQILEESMLSIN